jgi:zinc/manganese transport system permease protein
MLEDVLAFAALPIAAAVVLTGIHTWFGLQVLRRNVVFADLALAQLSALGATVAVVAGHAVSSAAGYAYTIMFAAGGALLLTASRGLARSVRQEAFIGVLYVVATAATVLVVDRSPQGAEHVKRMLVGSILSVSPQEVARFAVLYGAIGILSWFIRRPLLAAADAPPGRFGRAAFWDLVFYLCFGVVVTSSVAVAGVLLVFCFLIVPALIGGLFSERTGVVLAIGWAAGALASSAGILGSFLLDAPTGAVTVVAFAVALIAAGGVRAFIIAPQQERTLNRRLALWAAAIAVCAGVAVSGLWAIIAPAGDHPMLAAFEMASGVGPDRYLSARERADYLDALTVEDRQRSEIDRLNELERRSRWQGEELSAEEVRHIATVQRSLTEMSRGERFVVEHLRARARARERWYVGLPLAALGFLGLAGIAWPRRDQLRALRRGPSSGVPKASTQKSDF